MLVYVPLDDTGVIYEYIYARTHHGVLTVVYPPELQYVN